MAKKTREELLREIFPKNEYGRDDLLRVSFWHRYCDRAEAVGIKPLEYEAYLDLLIEHHLNPKFKWLD